MLPNIVETPWKKKTYFEDGTLRPRYISENKIKDGLTWNYNLGYGDIKVIIKNMDQEQISQLANYLNPLRATDMSKVVSVLIELDKRLEKKIHRYLGTNPVSGTKILNPVSAFVEEYIKHFLEAKGTRLKQSYVTQGVAAIRAAEKQWGFTSVEQVTSRGIKLWFQELTASQQEKYGKFISPMFKYFKDDKVFPNCDIDPIGTLDRKPREDKIRGPITDDNFSKIKQLAILNDKFFIYAYMVFAMEIPAARREDIVDLRFDHWNKEEDTLHVFLHKTQSRKHPKTKVYDLKAKPVLKAFLEQLEQRNSKGFPYLLEWPERVKPCKHQTKFNEKYKKGDDRRDVMLLPGQVMGEHVSKQFAKLRNMLPEQKALPAMERTTIHEMRHYVVSKLIEQGIPLYEISFIMEHQKTDTTEIYDRRESIIEDAAPHPTFNY